MAKEWVAPEYDSEEDQKGIIFKDHPREIEGIRNIYFIKVDV
jgi:hypothetical protein